MLVFAGFLFIAIICTAPRVFDVASLDAIVMAQIEASRSLLSSIEYISFQNFESFITLSDVHSVQLQENSQLLNS
ncbi:hypothetical protein ACSFA3_22080 [Variovorax sp. RHLX14]|uniref:hypothetical protein n=1 Tax=Variovorax sp. RHLX14 TaxID=1259731 RepID=UPI003F458E7D